jgi:aspartyl-tRNA(Asn)/glutamyl-tRNA(Gln) amidotransferase subunit A
MSDTDPALMSAETLLGLYARRRLSPVEALKAVLERVARYNPWVNAFAAMNPRALQAAGESEARWLAGRPMGALDGVPSTVKDLLHLAGFPTRRGSRASDSTPMNEDAPAVMGLKQAGAVIIGKTTTTEFGWKSPGDCPLHGITRNPWNPQRTPGGSSSGAGAAGAACFGALHIGTDAGGSIRIPAAYCGLIGMKPSFGRIPQWPLGAFGHVAVAGPMTRTVRDAALMFGAMARHDLRDPYALPDDPRDWLAGIEDGVRGMRVALVRRMGFAPPLDAEGEQFWPAPRSFWKNKAPSWRKPIPAFPIPARFLAAFGVLRWRASSRPRRKISAICSMPALPRWQRGRARCSRWITWLPRRCGWKRPMPWRGFISAMIWC